MTPWPLPTSTPYPWPYDGAITPGRFALVVAGTDPYWSAAASTGTDRKHYERNLAALSVAIDSAGGECFAVRHPPPRRATLPPVGAEFDAPGVVVAAMGIDGCYGSALIPTLRGRGIDHVFVAGFGLEGPVHSTLRSLNDQGFECLLVVDASAPIDPGQTRAAISMVEMSGGIFGAAANTAEVVAAFGALRDRELREKGNQP